MKNLKIIFLILLLYLFKLFFSYSNLAFIYSVLGLLWPIILNDVEFKNKLKDDNEKHKKNKKKYRVLNIFLKTSKLIQKYSFDFLMLPRKMNELLSLIIPSILFVLCLSSLNDFQSFFYVILGNLTFAITINKTK